MNDMKIGGLVLAGGRALRMEGQDKALLRLENECFLHRLSRTLEGFEELFLSTNQPALAEGTPFVPVPDRVQGRGPLEGICAALTICKCSGLLVAACDMPLFSQALAQSLSIAAQGQRAVACVDRQGRLHPLCGVYMKVCLPEMEAAITSKNFRMTQVFRAVGGVPFYLKGTPFPDSVLTNINTPEEFAALTERQDL